MSGYLPWRFRAWSVVLAGLGINLILGVLYAWGVVAKALVGQWHWTRTEAALPFTVSTAAFAIMMVFAGRLQDRVGPRYVGMAGGILLGVGLIASAFLHTPGALLLSFGVVGGLGIGLGYSATTPPAIKWFPPARKGFITGIVVSGVGLAAVYMSPLAEVLLRGGGIPRTFLVLGVGTIILVSLLSQVLCNPPACCSQEGLAAPSLAAPGRDASRPDIDWREMLATPQFYLLWLMFVLASSAGLMIIAHAALIGKEQAGLNWGFLPIATLAIFNTAGRVLSGYVSDKIGRTRTMALAFFLQAVNMFLFTRYVTPGLLIFGSAFTGLCYGTMFTLMPSATADFYGVRNLGVNYGLLFTAFGVGGVFGPMLGGKIRDSFGSYGPSFSISAMLLFIGAVLAFTVRSPKLTGSSAVAGPGERLEREIPAVDAMAGERDVRS